MWKKEHKIIEILKVLNKYDISTFNSINFYKNNFNIKNHINSDEYYEKMVKKIKEMI